MKQFFFRAATYADQDRVLARLDSYVAARGWDPALRTYAPSEWEELIADANNRRFDAICARFDGHRWFSAVTSKVRFETVLPKRGKPKGPAKGGVIGGRIAAEEFAYRFIGDAGPKTLEEIVNALVNAGLSTGSIGSVRNIVRFAMKGSDRLAVRSDRDHGVRWRHRRQTQGDSPARPVAVSSITSHQLQAFAQFLAEGLVRELLANPERLELLLSRTAQPR